MKTTIITACYNSEKTILGTINSVKAQTYLDIEHIFIDGGSHDDTIKIIKENALKHFKLISEKDRGIYDAMNKGINFASGDLILILNSDDIFFKNNIIKKIVDIFEKDKTLELLYGDIIITRSGNVLRKWVAGTYKSDSFLSGWMPPHPAFVVKKSTYNKYGLFNLNFKYAADLEIMYRLLTVHRCKHFYLNQFLVDMKFGGKSSKNIINIIKQNIENIKILKKDKKFSYFKFFYNKIIHRLRQFKL